MMSFWRWRDLVVVSSPAKVGRHGLEIEPAQEVAHGLGAHAGLERVAVLQPATSRYCSS